MTGTPTWFRVARPILIAIGLVWSLGPLFLMYTSAFKSNELLYNLPPALLFTPTLVHFQKLFNTTPFFQYLWNTLIVATTTTVVSLAFGSLAAYSFTRFRYVGSDSLPLFYL